MVTIGLRNGWKLVAASTALLMLSGTLPALVGPSMGSAARTQCADGKDNDNDGRLDYPEDDDCENLNDDFEGMGLTGLFVSITDGKDKVRSGDAVTYVISLRQQREESRNVEDIDLFLPFQANGVNASEGGYYTNGDRVHWDNVSVPRGATKTITVQMNIASGAPVGKLLVTRVQADGEEATDTTMVDNPKIPYEKPLWITVRDGKEFVKPGEELTYSITLKNISTQSLSQKLSFSLPNASSFVSATKGYEQVVDKVNWYNVELAEGETKVFKVTVRTDNRVTNNLSIRGRAMYGLYSDNDDTVIKRGTMEDALKVSISDGRDQAKKGDLLTYTVSVRNTSADLSTDASIDASFPLYNEFVSATEGGYWDGKNVRWLHMPVAPNGVRTLNFTVRVRSDVPMNTDLLATARVDGQNGKSADDDYTTVVERISPYTGSTVTMTGNPNGTAVVSNAPVRDYVSSNVLFRKVADRSEAVAGGTIRYTLYVKNTLDHTIDDAVITDRFDPAMFVAMNGQPISNGSMSWNVPALRPGATWNMTYTLTLASNLASGTIVSNIATIEGNDLADIPLSERVRVVQTGIMTSMPQTGAAMDALFLLATAGFAAGSTFGQRRKFLGL